MKNTIDLEIIMPAYNEEDGIESTIISFYKEIAGKIRFRFIVSEDGSTDNTLAILQKLSRKIPILVLTQKTRQGYSQGMLRALRQSRAPYVCCVDSDGQYSPNDFWKFWNNRQTNDVVIGYRARRADPVIRVVMSRLFFHSFRLLYPDNVHDPSCSYILFRQEVAQNLVNILGLTNEGFWWEFMARVKQYKYFVSEQYVSHNPRKVGNTKIYSFLRLPKIVIKHVVAMIRVMVSGPVSLRPQ